MAMSRLVGAEFGALFRSFEHTAFRLETLDRYHSPNETTAWFRDWLSTIREATAAGRRFTRVRVVGLPLTDYSRSGLFCSRYTNAAGEDIRYLERDRAESAGLPRRDYWLFDSRTLITMHFDDQENFLGGEVVDDPAEIVRYNYWRDAASHLAVRRDDFAASFL